MKLFLFFIILMTIKSDKVISIERLMIGLLVNVLKKECLPEKMKKHFWVNELPKKLLLSLVKAGIRSSYY